MFYRPGMLRISGGDDFCGAGRHFQCRKASSAAYTVSPATCGAMRCAYCSLLCAAYGLETMSELVRELEVPL